MQSLSSEGIYASLQTRCSSPSQSPHELQKDVSSNSPPNMNQGLELTNFTEPQLQNLWDFPGELEGLEGFDTLPDIGLFEEDGGLDYQDGLDGLVDSRRGDDGNTNNLPQRDSTLIDTIYPAQGQADAGARHPLLRDGCAHALTEMTDVGKHTLKRPFNSIDDATNTPIDESSETAKRQCQIILARPNNSYHGEKDPSSCSHGAPASQHTNHGASTVIQGASNYSSTSGEKVRLHMLSLPPSVQQSPNDTSRAQREPSVDSLFDDLDDSTVPPSHHQPLSLPGSTRLTVSPSILSPPESPLPEEPTFSKSQWPKAVSEIIRKNNSIENQDVVSSMYREIFTMPRNAQKYISPYPRMGGPLGYLPSTPVAHVKCVEVAKDTVANRMNQYRKIIHKLRYDRDKYLWLSTEWNAVDSKTGKTKAQQTKEECSGLRRSITLRNKAVNEAMAETEFWRNKYRNLETAYCNLANQYKIATASNNRLNTPASQPQPASQPSSQPATRTPSISSTPCSEPVSIDLTAEEPGTSDPTLLSQTSSLPEPRTSALSRMRKKRYNWLNNGQPFPKANVTENNGDDDEEDELSQMLMRELEAST
ncbi:hypothetical protein McanMca71_007577 [Microsporum canis]|uniref:Uncharacterized protein n=1 Tax=Arthroderma otae (strain ATCC MYA-4605 / CBS 113480) TaxID=554155 RepID=C5G0Q8_ARTOC|nr:conserved hypothetical protein [Microsporum canis CBS 113480]EEQ35711.1 conserved hypothetical protein [Microsporum canis CBS 113480]